MLACPYIMTHLLLQNLHTLDCKPQENIHLVQICMWLRTESIWVDLTMNTKLNKQMSGRAIWHDLSPSPWVWIDHIHWPCNITWNPCIYWPYAQRLWLVLQPKIPLNWCSVLCDTSQTLHFGGGGGEGGSHSNLPQIKEWMLSCLG